MPNDWRVENPADLPSRGLSPLELSLSSLWIKGPRWLGEPACDDHIKDTPMPSEFAAEMRGRDSDAALNLFVASEVPSLNQVIRYEDFSSFQTSLHIC